MINHEDESATGKTLTFKSLKKMDGSDVSKPTIYEAALGVYYFDITPTEELLFSVWEGSGDITFYGTMSAEAVTAANIQTILDNTVELKQYQGNKMEVVANQLIIYEDNGVDVLKTFNLFDLGGNPTSVDATKRVPV